MRVPVLLVLGQAGLPGGRPGIATRSPSPSMGDGRNGGLAGRPDPGAPPDRPGEAPMRATCSSMPITVVHPLLDAAADSPCAGNRLRFVLDPCASGPMRHTEAEGLNSSIGWSHRPIVTDSEVLRTLSPTGGRILRRWYRIFVPRRRALPSGCLLAVFRGPGSRLGTGQTPCRCNTRHIRARAWPGGGNVTASGFRRIDIRIASNCRPSSPEQRAAVVQQVEST